LAIVDDMRGYFENIRSSVQTLSNGMKLTLKYLWEARESRTPIGIEDPDYFKQETGIVTLQYPYETLPVPDNGRYRLHNEIDDCIVCDKCAKICPVNCIEIEAIKAVEDIGQTSDGSVKRLHAAKFNIDMAKCCFCGLCTTVCPTECLTMTPTYDFSEFDVRDHTYAYAEMTPLEILEKKQLLQKQEEEKARHKARQKAAPTTPRVKPSIKVPSGDQTVQTSDKQVKPAFRPKVKPKVSGADNQSPTAKPIFRPKIKPKAPSSKDPEKDETTAKPKPVFKPKVKPKTSDEPTEAKAAPKFRPKIKPVIKKKPKEDSDD
jgi:formate hydrogenlyase subunit 6/NADH:ubiquinone oxidoreductase subunit I